MPQKNRKDVEIIEYGEEEIRPVADFFFGEDAGELTPLLLAAAEPAAGIEDRVWQFRSSKEGSILGLAHQGGRFIFYIVPEDQEFPFAFRMRGKKPMRFAEENRENILANVQEAIDSEINGETTSKADTTATQGEKTITKSEEPPAEAEEAISLPPEAEAFLQRYSLQLNTKQKIAMCALEGPVLLLAVPGSGKTTVLVTRLRWMREQGIPAESILSLTYTVAATRDMRARYVSLFGQGSDRGLTFSTINGFCAGVIRAYRDQISGRAFELLSDTALRRSWLTEIYRKYLEDYPTEGDLEDLETKISFSKNMLHSEEERKKLDTPTYPFSRMFRDYTERLQRNELMDFDDQLVYALRILRNYPQLLEQYRARYPYVCVDEAQDTSLVQHAVISLLAGERGNLFMVGDEDQSIYGFRAAWPEALYSFDKDHPGARILTLDINYRSGKEIVDKAQAFISSTGRRWPKIMKAALPEEGAVEPIFCSDRQEQYRRLGAMLREEAPANTLRAVLFRDNESALPLMLELEAAGVPYAMRQSRHVFFSSRVVQDIRNIYTFAFHPEDTALFMRLYYKLNFYLNRETAEKITSLAQNRGLPVWEAARLLLPSNNHGAIAFRLLPQNLEKLRERPAVASLDLLLKTMGYENYCKKSHFGANRLDTLAILAQKARNGGEFLELLDRLEKLVDERVISDNASERLILSTIHSSKGLEYDWVYLIDCYDGILPAGEEDDEEEEKRLFYVAITRAKKHLTVFLPTDHKTAFGDMLFGKKRRTSRKTAVEDDFSRAISHASGKSEKKPLPSATPITSVDEKTLAAYQSRFASGKTVIHRIFGQGVVTEVSDGRIRVRFAHSGEKELSLRTLCSRGLVEFPTEEE